MAGDRNGFSRRGFLTLAGGLGGSLALGPVWAKNGPGTMRIIPKTGGQLPAIGMGSWRTFDVQTDEARDQRVEVLRSFFAAGGGMIDSSPMYGHSEEVIGYGLSKLDTPASLFSATKVWIYSATLGIDQMRHSARLWGLDRFDLMQIHNMLDWETHLKTLLAWKDDSKVRHIGITTSHGRRHTELAQVMATEPFDFVQFTYNILDREAEARLLPLAADKGLAVIINRPFRRGGLFDHVAGKPLPAWAGDIDCRTWAQFFLKFIISHPAVTCAIPATRRPDHMGENMEAMHGRLPGPSMRRRMIEYVENI